MSDVSRRRPNHLGDAVFLHVLRHVYPYHGLLISEEGFRQRLRKLRLSDAGRAKEQEGADGAFRVFQSHPSPLDCLRNCGNSLVLPDHPLMEHFF